MDERGDSSENAMTHFNGGSFNNIFQVDLMQETEFEKFISGFRSEIADPIEKFCLNYECNHLTDACTDLQLLPLPYDHSDAVVAGGGGGDTGGIGGYDAMGFNSNLIWNDQEITEEMKVSMVFGDDNSSETATTGNPDTPTGRSGGGAKGDRSRTLISERKRRSGMKEKLYALRSLVPNITKMDKASIVGDAARYIQELQTQARNLKAEIETIEAIENQRAPRQISKKNHHNTNSFPVLKKISKMDVFQVEEKGYYVRLVCNKGKGVGVSLHRALESITSFHVQTSNLATDGDNFVLTFNLNVRVCEFDINLPNLKLWLAGAFLNQGFEFISFPSA